MHINPLKIVLSVRLFPSLADLWPKWSVYSSWIPRILILIRLQ